MNMMRFGRTLFGAAVVLALVNSLTSCGWVNDDLEPCTVSYRVRFKYDYNIKHADAFPAEVRSVKVWAFDTDGNPVWQGEASGDALADPDFAINVDLKPGRYSFLTWGGLKDSQFRLTHGENPGVVADLGVELPLKSEVRSVKEGNSYSDYELIGLYHGYLQNVELKSTETAHLRQDIVIPLVKNTNNISVMLQHIKGDAIKQDDFTVSITSANSLLDWDNTILGSPEFTYKPWAYTYGLATSAGEEDGVSVNSLLAEMSTSRLMADGKEVLSVVRNTDNLEIIRIPLIQYLLLVKGNYHRDLTDQEYLDRQDEYSMIFFLTEHNTWYKAGGIYINSWAVVPPQNDDEL